MRLRNVKGSRSIIETSEFIVNKPEEYKGRWKEVFLNDNPIQIEIGMGKGQFITSLALKNSNINYIGIEKYSSVLVRAIEKQQELELDNLCFIRMDAEAIINVFAKNEIDKIYLNFSDPWPKDRHAKRRLTARQFLERYDQILKPEGRIEFKTDNRALFDFSLEEVNDTEWILEACTFDLHHEDKMKEGNIMTEYEEKFSAIGNPIHKLITFRETVNK